MTARGGRESLELIDSACPDIMLLDVIMPGIDGFEVLQKVRSVSDLPIIVFSARSENAQRALNLGSNAFMPKPLNLDDLIKEIETLLSSG